MEKQNQSELELLQVLAVSDGAVAGHVAPIEEMFRDLRTHLIEAKDG